MNLFRIPLLTIFSACVLHAQLPPSLGEPAEKNLLTNGNFADGTTGWEFVSWGKNDKMEIDMDERHEGNPTLRVENPQPGHAFVRQIVTGKPHTHYRLTAYIKTRNVQPAKRGEKTGAILEVGRTSTYTPPMQKTEEWKKVSVNFETKDTGEIRVGPSLGTDASFASGTAWFSDVTLIELTGGSR